LAETGWYGFGTVVVRVWYGVGTGSTAVFYDVFDTFVTGLGTGLVRFWYGFVTGVFLLTGACCCTIFLSVSMIFEANRCENKKKRHSNPPNSNRFE
jgi:hypothetical protein